LEEDIINMPPSTIMDAFSAGVKQLTALSLGAGLPNALSVPHMISNGFKNTLAIGLSINYKFAALQKAQSAGPAQGNAPAQNNAQAKKAEVQAAPEPEPVEENVSMGGLFD
jgi:large subunit ribosomal protein LP0